MSKCDDIYNRIQRLQEQQKRIREDQAFVFSAGQKPDPSRRFVTRTVEGEEVEIDFDELWKGIESDGGLLEWAQNKAELRTKPRGRDGYFENFGVLVDRLGFDDAAQAGAFMQKLTGNWQKADPADYAFVTAVNGKEQWGNMVRDAFLEAGLDPSDNIVQAIAVNGAPFLDILQRQTKLEVFDWTTKNALGKTIQAIQDNIEATGVAPTRALKSAFISAYRKSMYAHRTARLAKRRAGQLLQNYQRHLDGEMQSASIQGRITPEKLDEMLTTPESRQRLNEMMEETGAESFEQLKDMTRETIGVTTEEMVQEGSLAKAVIDAANKGAEGLEELEQIKQTIKKESVDPAGDNADDVGWERTWRRNARAGYKDSILFNPKSQLMANYLSQKIVFITEGYRTMGGAGWDLYARRNPVLEQFENADGELEMRVSDKVKVTPLATGFMRDVLKANFDGARIAAEAGLMAEQVIKQSWGETIQKSFLGDENPFAGSVDNFSGRGMLDIAEQYRVARSVLDEPLAPLSDYYRWPMQLRNKLHHSWKLRANEKLWNKLLPEGVDLPIYSGLQMMTAVDQRAGLRNFMTIRAFDLLMREATNNPNGNMAEWKAKVISELDEQLYSETPSQAQIDAAREQFNLSKEDLTDEQVEEYIVGTRVGMPVLIEPGQARASQRAIDMRMQGDVKAPGFKQADQAVRGIRQGEWGDSAMSFWRSPINQVVFDVAMAATGLPVTPVYRTLKVAGYMVQGKPVPVQLLVKAQASVAISGAMMAMFASLKGTGNIVGSGPQEPNAKRAWRERLAAEGKVPNSIFGVPMPFGGVPILNTLFLYSDAADMIGAGGVSEWDQQNAAWDITSLLGGIILRMPGFAQIEQITELLQAQGSDGPRKAAQFAAFWGNGQFNLGSGLERFGEWTVGLQSRDLMMPKSRASAEDRYDLSQLEEGHPLRSALNAFRDFTYFSNPGLSYFSGSQLKEVTWLGRPVRRPDGILRGELPIGIPGIWEFNKGEYEVETQLEQLGMLDPPVSILTGEVQGVMVTEEGRKQLNDKVGSIKADLPFSEASRLHPSGVVYRGPQIQYELETPGSGEIPELAERVEGAAVDVTELLDRVTKGNTVREALNELFKSPEWEQWRSNELTTWDPSVADMPVAARRSKIGPFMVNKIKQHYEDLAIQEFQTSGSEASRLWIEDKNNAAARNSESQADLLQEAFDAVVAPAP